MIEQCFGCPTQPVSKLGWFKSPCICMTTETAEVTEPEEPETVEEPAE
jgi:hypothetical protein